jgi:CubicO group peptidase (beta-lactamase class C family)
MAAAGLWTTPADLGKLGIEVQRALRGESSFLSKASAEEMLTRQMEDVGVGFFLEGKGTRSASGTAAGTRGSSRRLFSPNLNLEVTFKSSGKGRAESVVVQQEKLGLEAKRKP